MKKINIILSAFAAVIAAVSCSQTSGPEKPDMELTARKLTVDAAVDAATKVSLDGLNLAWESGDQIMLRWAGGTYSNTTEATVVTTTGTGSFSGELDSNTLAKAGAANAYFFSSRDGAFTGTGAAPFKKTVSSTQTGALADLHDHMLFYAYLGSSSSAIKVEKEGDTVIGVSVTSKLTPFFSILKLNVPSALGVTAITLEADNIAGSVTVHPARANGVGAIGSNKINRSDVSNTITVSDGGSTLSGDVYFVVLPDSWDSETSQYYCSASSLRFTFTTAAGDVTVSNTLSKKIYNATVKTLGTVKMPVPGSLKLMEDNNLVVGMNGYEASCTYYYTTGADEASCADPTTSDTAFDPAVGFTLTPSGTNSSWYVKVLAHSAAGTFKDTIFKGYVRDWALNKNSPVIDALKAVGVDSGTAESSSTTSDGIEVWRRTASSLESGDSEFTTARIALNTAHVAISCAATADSDAWIKFVVDKSTSVASGKNRGYRLYTNHGNGVNTLNGYTTNVSITSDGTSARVPIVWRLGTVSTGDLFGLRGDGKHVWYRTVMLENL